MIESYWPVWVIIGIIFFIQGHLISKLQDHIDVVELMLKDRVDLEMYLELLSEVRELGREIKKMKEEK